MKPTKAVISKAGKLIFGSGTLINNAALSTISIKYTVDFFDSSESEDSSYLVYLFVCLFFLAIPTMLAIFASMGGRYSHKHHSEDEALNPAPRSNSSSANLDPENTAPGVETIEHPTLDKQIKTIAGKISGAVIIGGPPGAAAGATCAILANQLYKHYTNYSSSLPKSILYPGAAILAVISLLGNYFLHDDHHPDSESKSILSTIKDKYWGALQHYWELFKPLSVSNKLYAIYNTFGIFFGHALQAYGTATFVSLALELQDLDGAEGAVAHSTLFATFILLTATIEGYTEALEDIEHKKSGSLSDIQLKSLLANIIPAITHALITLVGVQACATDIAKYLKQSMNLLIRSVIFGLGALTFFLPNFNGYFFTTIDSVDDAIKEAMKEIRSITKNPHSTFACLPCCSNSERQCLASQQEQIYGA